MSIVLLLKAGATGRIQSQVRLWVIDAVCLVPRSSVTHASAVFKISTQEV